MPPQTKPQINVHDPDIYERGIPHESFAYLRRESPIYWQPEPAGTGYWVVTKYDDVVTVSRDPATYSSYVGTALMDDRDPEAVAQQQLMMLNQDPPDHTRLRALVNRGFTPRMIARLDDRVGELCRQLVSEMAAKGTTDFVHDVAAQLPLAVIADMLGADKVDREKIFNWSNRMIGFDDPEMQTTPDDGKVAAMELFMYANELGQQRRAAPRDDICTKLVQPDDHGDVLSELEFDLFFLLLAVAGNETTRNAASQGMLAFFEHPDQWQRLREDRSLLPSAVEEVLRWSTPVIQFRRTATRDTELRGQRIAKGDKVIVYYCSANHDEDVFADPDRFDVGRNPNPHLTFGGGGPHFCLGLHLARLELRQLFATLLDQVPDIELVAPARRLRSNFINGIKEMTVRCP
jgi:cholest-4-en-3-one 26-monooxygenase